MDANPEDPVSDGSEESLSSAVEKLLSTGVKVDDIPALGSILANQDLLIAFVGLFRGSYEDVMLRLLVLTHIAERGRAPRWAPEEIRSSLSFLPAGKVENTLLRLRTVGLLLYEPSRGTYRLTPSAFFVLTAWTSVKNFAEHKFGELGFLNAQIAGSAETIGVPEQILNITLAGTETLKSDIENAITTGSASAIRAAREKVAEAFRWAEKGVDLLEKIAPDTALSSQRRETARELAQSQSSLLSLLPRLDHIIHQIESQRIHLGQSGLTTTDIQTWLRGLSTERLYALSIDSEEVVFNPPKFLLGDIALDVAEDLLSTELIADEGLPPPPDIENALLPDDAEDLKAFEECYAALLAITEPTTLRSLLQALPFGEASYRFSLLPLIGEKGELSQHDPAAKLLTLNLEFVLKDILESIEDGELERLTEGELKPAMEPGVSVWNKMQKSLLPD